MKAGEPKKKKLLYLIHLSPFNMFLLTVHRSVVVKITLKTFYLVGLRRNYYSVMRLTKWAVKPYFIEFNYIKIMKLDVLDMTLYFFILITPTRPYRRQNELLVLSGFIFIPPILIML